MGSLYAEILAAHRDARLIAPLADAGVVEAVDGAVGPFSGGGGKLGGVGVAGGGIDGEEGEPFAVAINLDFDAFELAAVAAPIPRDFHFAAIQPQGEQGLERGGVERGAHAALQAEGLADGGRAIFMRLQRTGERAEAGDDAGRDGGREAGRKRGDDGIRRGAAAAIAQVVFPRRPALGALLHLLLVIHERAEVDGIGGLLDDLGSRSGGGAEAEGGEVGRDAAAEADEKLGFPIIIAGHVVGFWHGWFSWLGWLAVGWLVGSLFLRVTLSEAEGPQIGFLRAMSPRESTYEALWLRSG